MFLKQSIQSDAATKEGLKIIYDDVAPHAKENSNPKVVDAGLRPRVGLYPHPGLFPRPTTTRREFPDLRRDDLTYPGYALCLPRFALLDGRFINFPDAPDNYGYISDEMSNNTGVFNYDITQQGLKPHAALHPSPFLYPQDTTYKHFDTPVLTVDFNQKFTSVGILLTFNLMSGDYCSHINVKWYANDTLLSSVDFRPDSPRYFCSNYVSNYNRLVITFLQTHKPNRPVFLTRIDYGIYRDFFDNELLETSCLQEINAISENVSINTLGFTVRTQSNIPFDLQRKQKLRLYFNGKLLGTFYLKNGARKNKTDYRMDSHDANGVLDGNEFSGGIYEGNTVGSVIDQIFTGEDFNYLLDTAFTSIPLYGYLPYTTKRNALTQIAFAIGAVVDTSNYDGVLIYPQQTTLSGNFLPADTFEDVTIDHDDIVTGIRLTVHSYKKIEEVEELYNDVLNGTAEIIFSEPHHSLSITGGAIKESNANHAIVIGTGAKITLTGKKYSHLTNQILKENPDIHFNKNIKDVPDATLVSAENANKVLDRVYAYYQRAENTVGEVLLGDKTLGQVVEIGTGYDGKRVGTLERINYSFTRVIKAEVTIHE